MPQDVSIKLDNKATYLLEDIFYLDDIISGVPIYVHPAFKDRSDIPEYDKLDGENQQKKQWDLLAEMAKYLIRESKLGEIKVVRMWPYGMRVFDGKSPRFYGISIVYRKDTSILIANFDFVDEEGKYFAKGKIDSNAPKEIIDSLKGS